MPSFDSYFIEMYVVWELEHSPMTGLDAGDCAFPVLFRVVHRGAPAYAGALSDELKRMFGNSDDFNGHITNIAIL